MLNKVKFKIGDIEFEAEGDAEIIERERKEFVTTLLPLAVDAMTRTINNRQIPQNTTLPQSVIINGTDSPQDAENFGRTSLALFIKEKGAESDSDFILCAMSFKERRKEMDSFSSTTLKPLFSDAKKPLPDNISDLLYKLAKRGLIMEPLSKKGIKPIEYVLTNKGEEYVNDLHPKQTKAKKTSSKPRKQQKILK